jgi:hypothetical protein
MCTVPGLVETKKRYKKARGYAKALTFDIARVGEEP